jgi:phosphonopyruvate decarboxylase
MTLNPKDLYSEFRKEGIDFFTGVPDSLLKDFCAFLDCELDSTKHVIAANEGSAVGLAAGHYLSTGKASLVYMQNSGIGNAVNPFLSLCSPEVYGIPMIVLVGWRGEPGLKDEPQHLLQGRVMTSLLEALEIPWFELSSTSCNPTGIIEQAIRCMNEKSAPTVLLVRKNTFSTFPSIKSLKQPFELTREDAIKIIIERLSESDLVVSTTGKTSRELFELRKENQNGKSEDFLTVGSMGHSSSIAMGVALGNPSKRVVCVDGDGAVIMHMGALAVIGQAKLNNLLHIVLNNGSHDSVGGQPTVGLQIDLAKVAIAIGYQYAMSVETKDELIIAIDDLKDMGGTNFLEVRIKKGAGSNLGRPSSSPKENKSAFMKKAH